MQVWWYCFHSWTLCITDIQWWQHAYVDPQRNWSKCGFFCFLSSRDVTIHNICWSYHCYDSKLSIRHRHHRSWQLLAALCLSLRRKLKTVWNFLLGSSYRIPCLVEKKLMDIVFASLKGFNLFIKTRFPLESLTTFYILKYSLLEIGKKSNGKQIWQ